VDLSTVAGHLKLISAGADGVLGTPDDLQITSGTPTVSGTLCSLNFANALEDGVYRVDALRELADLDGATLAADYSWSFSVSSENLWTGALGSEWLNALNWNLGRVPNETDRVIFPSAVTSGSVSMGEVAIAVKTLEVRSDITLVGGTLSVAGEVTLGGSLSFSGKSVLSAATIKRTQSGALIRVVPGTETGAGSLTFASGLRLGSHLDLDVSSGSVQCVVVNTLELGGFQMHLLGGLDSRVSFSGDDAESKFEILGSGTLGFAWAESILEDTSVDLDSLLFSVQFLEPVTLPDGVTLNSGPNGQVRLFAPQFDNEGSVRVEEFSTLKIYNYTKDPSTGQESIDTQNGAVFEKLTAEVSPF
jgi:hypothetical protein